METIYASGCTLYDHAVSLADNLHAIQQRIRAACERAGRDANEVTLLAVAKTQPPEAVKAAAAIGLSLFGENKVQEAKAKIPLCPGRLRWHFIGHLQSNKCRDAVHFFEMIQSVDSLSLAQEINRRAEQAAKTMPVLLEVNLAGEASKFGYTPDRLLAEFRELNELPRIEIRGLMTVPPWTAEAEKVRPHFRRLRELKGQCEQIVSAPLQHLSMGMSGDFEIAIGEGATIVRIGTALFGERPGR
jgi:pyridoxal phosphate enzyme (YggS family)